MSGARVAVTIVTWQSAEHITGCLQAVLAQDYPPELRETIVVDNASADGTQELLAPFAAHGVHIALNRENVGFAAGQNQAIAMARAADWVLTLNPDVRLSPDFLSRLLSAAVPEAGSLAPKLLAADSSFSRRDPPVLDSTGIYFTRNLRHFDRGNGEVDHGQFDNDRRIFGGTGAACCYRRAMIESVQIAGEFFDEAFFAYREDADVAWRAQLLGWQCLYVPGAIAWHVRRVTPERRRTLPSAINMHSVKNRWLMRMKNMTPDLYRRHWVAIILRDLIVVGGCLLREWGSLEAFPRAFRLRRAMREKRREIMRRRQTDDAALARWFLAKH